MKWVSKMGQENFLSKIGTFPKGSTVFLKCKNKFITNRAYTFPVKCSIIVILLQ